ncbi:MAG: hypothetical protein ACXABG_11175, partial [Promethearchaeota archaeon]
ECNRVTPKLILISQIGYDREIKNYLRTHLIREVDYTIPLIVVPPFNNEVWHNFIEDESVRPQKRTELENILRIGNREQVSPSYRNNMVKSAKSEYEQIIERDKLIKFDDQFLEKWHWILNVSNSAEILKTNKDNGKFYKNITTVKKKLSIY